MTQKNFPNYSVAMQAELAALEEKVRQVAALCRQLREENRELRLRVAALAGDNKKLADKAEGARERLEQLLLQIHE